MGEGREDRSRDREVLRRLRLGREEARLWIEAGSQSISRQGEPREGAGPACWEVTSKLRRVPLPGQGPTPPPPPKRLITLSHLSPGPTAAVTSQHPVALCRVGSQASPPARRVQDRWEVLLGKSLELISTARPAAGMHPLPQASAGRNGLLTAATGPPPPAQQHNLPSADQTRVKPESTCLSCSG